MPPKSHDAGILRTSQIHIAGSAKELPTADRIPELLLTLCQQWNTEATKLPKQSIENQVHAMAIFHHALLSIHPFTDGNGALARTLLSMQLQNLMGISKAVIFDDRQQYFDALRRADDGDLTMLEGLIRELTESIA